MEFPNMYRNTMALDEECDNLRVENKILKEAITDPNKVVLCKVTSKGGIALSNVRKTPLILHKEELLKLLDAADFVRIFIDKNDAHLLPRAAATKR